MMREKNNQEDRLIDEYYNEALNSNITSDSKFKASMEKSLAKMDIIEDLDFPLDINILEIISKGEEVKDKRKVKFELAGFIAVCFLIISTLTALLISTNPKIYLYAYAAVSAVLPLIVIPIARNAKGEA
jgi:hypothetical protein